MRGHYIVDIKRDVYIKEMIIKDNNKVILKKAIKDVSKNNFLVLKNGLMKIQIFKMMIQNKNILQKPFCFR